MQKQNQNVLSARSFGSETHQGAHSAAWTTVIMTANHCLLYSHFLTTSHPKKFHRKQNLLKTENQIFCRLHEKVYLDCQFYATLVFLTDKMCPTFVINNICNDNIVLIDYVCVQKFLRTNFQFIIHFITSQWSKQQRVTTHHTSICFCVNFRY